MSSYYLYEIMVKINLGSFNYLAIIEDGQPKQHKSSTCHEYMTCAAFVYLIGYFEPYFDEWYQYCFPSFCSMSRRRCLFYR